MPETSRFSTGAPDEGDCAANTGPNAQAQLPSGRAFQGLQRPSRDLYSEADQPKLRRDRIGKILMNLHALELPLGKHRLVRKSQIR